MRSLDVPVDAWLGAVIEEVERTAETLDALPLDDGAIAAAHDAASLATLQLDGSPIDAVPPRPAALSPGTATGPARGGWLEVLRSGTRELTSVPDEVVLSVEHHGARAGLAATDLAPGLTRELPVALAALHGRVTDGLVHPAVAGRPRHSEQAVHDASLGRVLFFPVDPASLPQRTAELADWLARSRDHAVVISGVLHHQVLDLHPYEAANGRLARIAARLLLADAGLDVRRVGQPEQALRSDPIGYLDQVGRSRRLGDPRAFVTCWAEALSDGLLAALRAHRAVPEVDVPAPTRDFLHEVGSGSFTVVEHRDAVGGGAAADASLRAARTAGLATRLAGSRGLRWSGTGDAATG